jgi:putative PEP-CTERM system histidine kinase
MTETDLATVGLWSYGLATAAFLAFAGRLTLGWRPGMRAALLLAATLITALWAGAGVAAVYRPGFAMWFASTFADALRYTAWFLFLSSVLQGARLTAKTMWVGGIPRWIGVLVAIALVACVLMPPPPPAASIAEVAGRIIAFGLRLGLAIFGLILVEQLISRAEPSARWALKPLCIGLAGVFAFDLYFFADAMLFGRLDAEIWVARGAANALVIPFIAVATVRNPGLTIEMHLSRGAVFHSTAVLLSGAFLLIVAGAGYIVRFMGGDWGRTAQIAFFFFALLVGMLVVSSGKFRSRLRVFVSKHFFSYRYDYREEWLRFTRTLSVATRVRDVQEQTIRALADLVESPAGALWLRQEEESVFRPMSRWNMPATDAAARLEGSLPRFLEKTGWVVDLSEYAADRARYVELDVPDWLRDVPSAWLVVPLMSGTELIGFVVLAKSRAKIEVNWEVRDLLKVASRQAASYLGQVRAAEALVEARKFDAFNRMSAFVVHDLKNLVAQLSLMLNNAERHRDNPEFQRDMLATVEHVVGRMNQLMLQLRTGETPVGKPRLTDVESIVRTVCAAHAGTRAPVELDLVPGLHALGHEDRLDHVIGHLIQNAFDATSGHGSVKVRLYRNDADVVVEVTDTGIGMSAEFIRERLFKPFETSKPTGMGIGVYESAQYVAAIGGKILYDSTPTVGTRVRLLLPAGDSAVPPARAETIA